MAINYRACSQNPNGPVAWAYRLAGYLQDPAYIAAMTRREYGRAPSIDEIKAMQDDHRRRRENFASGRFQHDRILK